MTKEDERLSKMISIKSLTLMCLLLVEIIHSQELYIKQPIVNVNEGKLRGSVVKAAQGFTFYSFTGIPYAQPPVGPLRFKAPLPPLSWRGIRNATKYGSACAQFNGTFVGSEDCLFLNIFTKSLQPTAKFPVMIFIHGGGYASGAGNEIYGPDFLIQHDVILVTINYRLEILGHLSLNIPEVSGNAGMKDQVAALKWIRDNIMKFGGNPDNVTIFGESSGAGSVTYHMLSPMSKGLFHKAIVESGNCIQGLSIAVRPIEMAFRTGKILGIDTNDERELLDFFMTLDASSLTNLKLRIQKMNEIYPGTSTHFVPGIELKFDGIEAFIDEHPVSLLSNGKVNRVPLMIGYNSGECNGNVDHAISKLDVYNEQPSGYIEKEVVNKVSNEKLQLYGKKIKHFYVGDRNFTRNDREIITDMLTDIYFAYNTHRFANLYRAYSNVYFYRFNYVTELNGFKAGFEDLKGATHGDELHYLFSNNVTTKLYEMDKLKNIVDKVTILWTDFAKYGNPTPDNSLGVKWPLYSRKYKEYLNIEENLPVGCYADKERIELWNDIYSDAGLPHIINE